MSSAPPSPLATPQPWDLVADGYVAENLPAFEAFAREALRLSPPSGAILDVAAGPGSLSLLAARQASSVHAIDFAPGMLRHLTERAAAAGIQNVIAQVADGQALPFEDGSFDAAYSMFGLIFFPDRARGLAELARVLRPGKRALISSWPPFERIPTFGALFEAINAELPPSAPNTAPPPLGTAADFERELSAAGFREIEVHEHDVVEATSTPEQLWASFARGGAPVVMIRNRLSEAEFAAFSNAVVARLHARLGPEPRAVKLTALLGIGTR